MNCELCGNVIPAERMEALPDTRICVGCSERVGGEWDVRGVDVVTSKEGSMKKNYGGVEVVRTRRNIHRRK
jgi:RNA polymerase-binding transcription factor DksA